MFQKMRLSCNGYIWPCNAWCYAKKVIKGNATLRMMSVFMLKYANHHIIIHKIIFHNIAEIIKMNVWATYLSNNKKISMVLIIARCIVCPFVGVYAAVKFTVACPIHKLLFLGIKKRKRNHFFINSHRIVTH